MAVMTTTRNVLNAILYLLFCRPLSADFVSNPDVPDTAWFPFPTSEQQLKLFYMYAPNLIIPLIMTVDIGLRITNGLHSEPTSKTKEKKSE